MRPKLATLLIVAVQSVGMGQNVSAEGTFHFRVPVEVTIGGVVPPPFAVLELSGDSPYDHTSISSLSFSSAAGDILGYAGEYTGEFDSSTNAIVENSSQRLVEKELDLEPGNIVINASLVDLDPPAFNSGPFASDTNSLLRISIIRGDDGLSFIDIDTGGGAEASAFGIWSRIVPEPTSLAIAGCGIILGIGCRVRNGTS